MEKEVNGIAGELSGHVGGNAENYENQHGGYGFGVRNSKREMILEFYAAIYMTVRNTLFKKRESHLVVYKSGP